MKILAPNIFDPKSEKWYTLDAEGNYHPCYDEIDDEWELLFDESGEEISNSERYSVMEMHLTD